MGRIGDILLLLTLLYWGGKGQVVHYPSYITLPNHHHHLLLQNDVTAQFPDQATLDLRDSRRQFQTCATFMDPYLVKGGKSLLDTCATPLKKNVTLDSYGPIFKVKFETKNGVFTRFRLQLSLDVVSSCGGVSKGRRWDKDCGESRKAVSYSGSEECIYEVKAPGNKFKMTLNFPAFNFPSASNCSTVSHVRISDTGKVDGYKSYCGSVPPVLNPSQKYLINVKPKAANDYTFQVDPLTIGKKSGAAAADVILSQKCLCGVLTIKKPSGGKIRDRLYTRTTKKKPRRTRPGNGNQKKDTKKTTRRTRRPGIGSQKKDTKKTTRRTKRPGNGQKKDTKKTTRRTKRPGIGGQKKDTKKTTRRTRRPGNGQKKDTKKTTRRTRRPGIGGQKKDTKKTRRTTPTKRRGKRDIKKGSKTTRRSDKKTTSKTKQTGWRNKGPHRKGTKTTRSNKKTTSKTQQTGRRTKGHHRKGTKTTRRSGKKTTSKTKQTGWRNKGPHRKGTKTTRTTRKTTRRKPSNYHNIKKPRGKTSKTKKTSKRPPGEFKDVVTERVSFATYAWTMSIIKKDFKDKATNQVIPAPNKQNCQGVLIGMRHALTTAGCVQAGFQVKHLMVEIQIIAGQKKNYKTRVMEIIRDSTCTEGTVCPVLLKVRRRAKPVKLGFPIPICLPCAVTQVANGTRLTYSTTTRTLSATATGTEVVQPIQTNSNATVAQNCPNQTPGKTICVSGPAECRNTNRESDAGAPVFMEESARSSYSNHIVLIGLLTDCTATGGSHQYMDVTKFLAFIQDSVRKTCATPIQS